jgi:hypothetical protein
MPATIQHLEINPYQPVSAPKELLAQRPPRRTPAPRTCPYCKATVATDRCPDCGRDPGAPKRVCADCGRLTPQLEKQCCHCGACAPHDLAWKIPLIVCLFLAAMALSIALRML